MIIPCKDCICVAICRHKEYANMISDCPTITKHIHECEMPYPHKTRFLEMYECLKPTKWELGSEDKKGYDLIHFLLQTKG